MTDVHYPQGPAAWRSTIESGIGVTGSDGREAYRTGAFPCDELERWIGKTFVEGFSPNFASALVRNIRGLVAWAYGDGDEPCWPGSDRDDREPA